MSEHHDFSTDEPAAAAPPPPIVIVQQAGRAWYSVLFPPALIILAALAILSYQVRPSPNDFLPRFEDDTLRSKVEAHPKPKLHSGKVHLKTETEPEPGSLVTNEPPESPAPRDDVERASVNPPSEAADAVVKRRNPFDIPGLEPPQLASLEPKAATPAPALRPNTSTKFARPLDPPDLVEPLRPDPTPPPARRVEPPRAADPAAQARAKENAERRKAMAYAQARYAVEVDRLEFLGDLRRVLHNETRDAAREIANLMAMYGRNTLPEVETEINRARASRAFAELSLDQRVEHYRQFGLPEPRVLDDLARIYAKAIGSRRGPRTQEEALVLAARRLVNLPFQPPAPNPAAAAALDRR